MTDRSKTSDVGGDALDGLIAKWRDYARQMVNESASQPDRQRSIYCDGKARGFNYAADELEAALRPGSPVLATPSEQKSGAWVDLLHELNESPIALTPHPEAPAYWPVSEAVRNEVIAALSSLPQVNFCAFCHHRWKDGQAAEHCGDCHREFLASKQSRDALIAKWRERGLYLCPDVLQPATGWDALAMACRPLGAAFLQCADELAAGKDTDATR